MTWQVWTTVRGKKENKTPFRKKSELPNPPSHETLLTGWADRQFCHVVIFSLKGLWRLWLWIGSWSTYELKQNGEGCFKLYCSLKEISVLDVLMRKPRRDGKKSALGGQACWCAWVNQKVSICVYPGRSISKEGKSMRKNQCHIRILLSWKRNSGSWAVIFRRKVLAAGLFGGINLSFTSAGQFTCACIT